MTPIFDAIIVVQWTGVSYLALVLPDELVDKKGSRPREVKTGAQAFADDPGIMLEQVHRYGTRLPF